MMPLFISVLLAAMCLECRAQKENVLQPKGDVTATEGEAVTLDCRYNSSSTGPSLYWYKQDGNHSPKFILSRIKLDEGNTADDHKERFSSTLNSTVRSVPLKIQKLQVSDSAVYYCALQNTGGAAKLVFGSGTRLTIDPKEDYEPSYYKLTNENTMSCLATGFSRHNALSSNSLNWSEVVRISGDSLYNSVVLFPHGDNGEKCPENNDEPLVCVEQLKKGPTVNTVSLIVLGLRLLFIKTVIFNVLMTLRLWISQ